MKSRISRKDVTENKFEKVAEDIATPREQPDQWSLPLAERGFPRLDCNRRAATLAARSLAGEDDSVAAR